jgi:hypothetical protein
MKTRLLYIPLLIACIACKKTSSMQGPPTDSTANPAPKAVTKTVTKRVFAHMMPWFETNVTNGGNWGIHWTMATRNPDVIDPNGQREIASNYYPLIGPYASGDTMVIEYQLLLMKLSGIDGVFIDWPGTQNKNDYPLLVHNTEQIVSMLGKAGLQFAIVYEDQNLVNVPNNKVGQAQADMQYLQSKFFTQSDYENNNGKPLLLVFGPQQLESGAQWDSVFSVLPTQPSFFPLLYQSPAAGNTAAGEFSWVSQDNLTTQNNFYDRAFSLQRIGCAYPGFNSYYAQGGWAGPTWIIDHDSLNTFNTTLNLALSKSFVNYIQLVTWNDYGEGTIIEPTDQYQYGYLTLLQQTLGVLNLDLSDLQLVGQLFQMRKANATVPDIQQKLNLISKYIAALDLTTAKNLMSQLN